ncbi:hypothetical protein RRG08_036777 [Elysia crispata]|uniref:Uncharacterized protein n=1 Tax=Elysia crispata TaxID=231223 RepID=A0AAE1ADH8_9GAST|nr:hypothetical protein RRG08_036777 [Elysia crispata]
MISLDSTRGGEEEKHMLMARIGRPEKAAASDMARIGRPEKAATSDMARIGRPEKAATSDIASRRKQSNEQNVSIT